MTRAQLVRIVAPVFVFLLAQPVRGAIDMTGRWHVVSHGTNNSLDGETDWDLVQSGTALTLIQSGAPVAHGGINPETGSFGFVSNQAVAACSMPASGASGVVDADGERFTGSSFETFNFRGTCRRLEFDICRSNAIEEPLPVPPIRF